MPHSIGYEPNCMQTSFEQEEQDNIIIPVLTEEVAQQGCIARIKRRSPECTLSSVWRAGTSTLRLLRTWRAGPLLLRLLRPEEPPYRAEFFQQAMSLAPRQPPHRDEVCQQAPVLAPEPSLQVEDALSQSQAPVLAPEPSEVEDVPSQACLAGSVFEPSLQAEDAPSLTTHHLASVGPRKLTVLSGRDKRSHSSSKSQKGSESKHERQARRGDVIILNQFCPVPALRGILAQVHAIVDDRTCI